MYYLVEYGVIFISEYLKGRRNMNFILLCLLGTIEIEKAPHNYEGTPLNLLYNFCVFEFFGKYCFFFFSKKKKIKKLNLSAEFLVVF